MTKENIELFNTNTDAIATNRGFYYQYLSLLKKWIENYVFENEDLLYTEVDDDIKEVGEKIIFTQVKCYSKGFSLKSKEIKKTTFNFFILFLKNHGIAPTQFNFFTNTSVIKSEKLLKAWINDPGLYDEDIRAKCIEKIRAILKQVLGQKKNQKLGKKNLKRDYINKIKDASNEIKKEIESHKVEEFVTSISWSFKDEVPSDAINSIFSEINKYLEHKKFQGKPIPLLLDILLSEIYYRSQLQNKEERVLKVSDIEFLLNKTDIELKKYVNQEFLNITNFKLDYIKNQFETLQKNQYSHAKRIKSITNRLENVEQENQNKINSKFLTLLPSDFNKVIYGRDHEYEKIKNLLDKHHRLNISGYAGTGKSFFVQNFLKNSQDDFDHIIWIDYETSLVHSVVFNHVLARNLNLNFPVNEPLTKSFEIICNELNQLKGNNIFIIDNFNKNDEKLKNLLGLTNWSVVITSIKKLPNIEPYHLPQIDFEHAKKIFYSFLKNRHVEDEDILLKFFQYIEFNPLIIELASKTINNSLDLNLESFLTFFQNQNLDNEELRIDIVLEKENTPANILTYLQKKFELRDLSSKEEHYLNFLALLPSSGVLISELALIGGEKHYQKNKIDILNLVNSLHLKGWIEREGNRLKMHKIIQEVIRYNSREIFNSFVEHSFQITWLFHRIDETALNNPSKSFFYLKYAESILDAIKEPYRESIYQPLLLLENALLNAYNWFDSSVDIHSRWLDLSIRAKKYLSDYDTNLGIIFNNLALSYGNKGNADKTILYLEKAIEILSLKLPETINQLMNSYNNLSLYYLQLDNFSDATKIIIKASRVRQKYCANNYRVYANQINILGIIFQKSTDYEKAKNHFEKAIEIHQKQSKSLRNDFYLATYAVNLAYVLLLLGNKEEAESYLIKSIQILEEMNLLKNRLYQYSKNFLFTIKSL